MQQITIANGYYTDAGGFVTREPKQIPATNSALIAIALDAKQPAVQEGMRRTHRQLVVLVVGKVNVDMKDAQLRIHELMDDIERAVDQKQGLFPAGTQFPVFAEAKPIPPAEGMTWIGAEVRFTTHVPKR